jgi:hypothetical protein
VLIEQWRHHYNTIRPHSALGYKPPAPETIQPTASICPPLFMGSGQINAFAKLLGV